MMKMNPENRINDIEQCNNIIVLFKNILAFYANADNYIHQPKTESYDRVLSLILRDNGEQAKFALKTYDDLCENQEKMITDYENEIDNTYFHDEIELLKNINKE